MISDLFDKTNGFEYHFGEWKLDPQTLQLEVIDFSPLPSTDGHAEAQRPGVLGADFTYAANVQFGPGGDAHLQFRISDEGRYGVSIRESGLRFYRQLLNLSWELLSDPDAQVPLARDVPHALTITAQGPVFVVTVDDLEQRVEDQDHILPVGRFGLYAYRTSGSNAKVSFSDVRATTDPTAKSNFALLYNTSGYLLKGTKRGLVRTLNHLAPGILSRRSRFSIRTPAGKIMLEGRLARLKDTYGMQLWEADFSSLVTPGTYVLHVQIAAGSAVHILESSPFAVEERGFTRRLLKPLTILNAEARDAAEEDLRKNWVQRTPGFYVEPDGAFRVDDADDGLGVLIERSMDGYLDKVPNPEFADGYTLTGRVTILDGCDAQLQFGITDSHRYGVTLQAGSGGGCVHANGPGAIRLHIEEPFAEEPVNKFRPLAAYIFPEDMSVRAGVPCDLRIVVEPEGMVTVFVDGEQRLQHAVSVNPASETFGLKVWGGSARFENVAAWRPGIQFRHVQIEPGVWVEQPSLVEWPFPCDGSVFMLNGTRSKAICTPLFTQRRGFHDCNNYIAESNSHGAFLAGLVEVWATRRNDFSMDEQGRLRRAILTAVEYLEKLYRDAGATGRYKHEEPGRGGGPDRDEKTNQYLLYLTLSGVYGEAAFASRAADIEPDLAHAACRHAWTGSQWLAHHGALTTFHKALFYHQFAKCARRDPLFLPLFENDAPPLPGFSVADWLDQLAIDAGDAFLIGDAGFEKLNTLRTLSRDTGQMIPWLEGIYELRTAFPERTLAWDKPLKDLADCLGDYLLASNGFHVIPQSSGGGPDLQQNIWNWDHMETVPRVERHVADGRHFYNSTFFATMAADMVMLGRMTGNLKIEKLAAGHLGWVLGLNPGVPATKALNPSSVGTIWKAAAFVQNLGAPFSRGFENFPTVQSAKSWLWGGEDYGRHREVWWVDPLQNGFMTIVNGHTIWEGEWDYYNMGEFGWASGETFILDDGLYAKAAIAYEDWVAGVRVPWSSMGGPYREITAIPNQDGRIEVIVTRDDGTMWHRWQKTPDGSFDEWHRMDGFVTRPFGIHNLDGRIELLGRGTDGALWHRWQTAPNGPFAEWHSLEGVVKEGIATRNADGRIEVFVIWADGSLRHRWQTAPNGPFVPWHSLDMSARMAAVGMNLDGRIELFVQGSDGTLYHRWQTAPNSYFADWHSLGGSFDGVTVARNQDGRLEVFARGSDNAVYHRWQTSPNGPFADWHSLGGSVTQVFGFEHGDGRIELVALGTDHGMLRNIQTLPNGPFVGWEALGSGAAAFCATKQRDGRLALFALQTSGELWTTSQGSPGSWL